MRTLPLVLSVAQLLAAMVLLPAAGAAPVDFEREVRPIFQKRCYECHGEKKQKSGLRLDIKAAALRGGDDHAPDIVAGRAEASPLIRFITTGDEAEVMPPKGERLSTAEIATLTRWIDEGALWPDGVDTTQLEDRRDHWSFKPLAVPVGDHSVDAFITATLKANGLSMSPPASRAAWLRRVTLDLTGLPPTPDQHDAFIQDSQSDAFERVVECLLSSERYGERWAQHWLDVVRYADTHGFEVNTERPNAWHYRDYVIRAFNQDTPYDRFIKEQIVGDAMGEDAATGFLITASVLLPGQIGKDAPSVRLARQDSLDEIVNNISQTFLGLSVGCARCHDHKFDPITARDYYAMQAFVSGVEYEDRALHTPESEARQREAELLRRRVAEIERELGQFVPLARPGTQRRVTSPKENTESFVPLEAKFIRFTIHDANLHPTLGLIEPCVDEFEIFTDETPPRNLAPSAKVTASGSRASELHQLAHINDGRYGNSRSWMTDTAGRGWVMFELPQTARLARVVWSRDREGQFTDRLATAFTLEAGQTADSLVMLVEAPPLRPAVNPRGTTDRFTPVRAKRMRFTIRATNGLEPCLDELEVFNTGGENVALGSRGTTVKTSGDTTVADRHEQRFIHDGRYGNSRSWMSNELGGGWALLEFPNEEEIARVVWSRDREGEFEDRLPTEYCIEVAGTDGDWRVVSDSSDRRPFVAGMDTEPSFTLARLAPSEAVEAKRLLDEKQALAARIKAAEAGQLAFAGKFRAPDTIYRLHRGDPEQPKEEVAPAVLSALGTVTLTRQAAEQDRRKALADWIASPENPLTARVMVNRIWQGHFGAGLVQTPSDFGRNGIPPTHPELLDWLAAEFMRSGWSVKHMHRLIVLSETYRQRSMGRMEDARDGSSTPKDSVLRPSSPLSPQEIDSESRLLWRFPSRRIEAETLRDSMLAVSGQLNLQMYGRGYNLFDQRGGLSGFKPVETLNGENQRRLIYAHKVRRETEAVFGAFDCPDAGQSTALRRTSTTPIQALNLFNSRFTLDQSQAFADRVTHDAGADVPGQIQRAYQLALGRNATPEERRDATSVAHQYGLATVCRVLFNSNEFLFVP